MNTCWAACLGNCSDKISREHVITKSLFLDNEVTVNGLPWCVEPKTIGMASLTAKILCSLHNSELSELDQEAVLFGATMREAFRLLQVRVSFGDNRRWSHKVFRVNGM